MEKKRAANSKFKVFLKKNVYYIIMAVCLIAIAAMVTVTLITKNNANIEDPGIDTGNMGDNGDNVDDGDDLTNPDNPTGGDENVDPSPVQIVFGAPVADVNIIRDYSMDSLVWHTTLKHFAVHSGVDFGGNDGDSVMSVYAGTVTAVTYDVLNGYTVTVTHNDSLVTTYSSLNEPAVVVGQTVAKGDVIGTMGITGTNEYLDGAHVHFCLYENGQITDPYTYLSLGDK